MKLFALLLQGPGHPFVQRQPSGFVFELWDKNQAEAQVVVAVVGVVVVAIGYPAILRVVVPAAATINAVRTLNGLPVAKVQF